MAEKYDVVVAGAGHNGLLVAAYLAKAGAKVCVVEKQEYVGGGVVTRNLTGVPGFKHDYCSTWHGFIQPNPLMLNDELALLSKYGLKYIIPDTQTAVLFPDDEYMMIYKDIDKTCESIAQYSPRDAEAYKKFHDWAAGALDLLTQGLYNPPASFGAMAAMFDQSEEGRDLLRCMMLSAVDICNEWFEDPRTKIMLTRYASEGMIAPQTKGTGMVVLMFVPLQHKYGGAIPVGGSGVLSEAIASRIRDDGGDIRLGCPVKNFKVVGGEAKGVVLETGEEILAEKALVTNFHIKQVFPGMVGEGTVDPGFVRKVGNLVHADFVAHHQEFALNEAPKWKAGGVIDRSIWIELCEKDFTKFLMDFDKLTYGIPCSNFPIAIISTHYDKTRAPEGKHTLYLYHFEPYDIADGGAAKWDEINEEFADEIFNAMKVRCTNLTDDNILGRWISNPLDYERHNPAFVKGDITHLASHMWQSAGNRPLPGWNYRTPVDKLYMCGPSTHPGMGVIGGGRAAVQVVMEDLGIDFEKIIA